MPASIPPPEVLDEFLGATTRHTRRVEIYEQDGETRWEGDTQTRLKDGSVTVDYDRDERRALDLTLSNDDDGLVTAPGEFWYDKVIKVYRGVKVNQKLRPPKVLIVSDTTVTPHSGAFRTALAGLGYGDVQINTLASSYNDLAPYDIIVGLGGANQGALLAAALSNGKSVFTFRSSSQDLFDAEFTSGGWTKTAATATPASTISPRQISDPRTLGWASYTPESLTSSYNAPVGITSGPTLFGVAFADGSTSAYAISSHVSLGNGRAISVHYPLTPSQYAATQFSNFLRTAMAWLNPVVPIQTWETQIGEFMVDRISEANFPYDVKITGRDYVKKCMLSKFAQATQFTEGSPLEGLIGDLAANAGITRTLLPATGVTVASSFFFDRGTSRWDAMKQIATAYNYEIFFDATGYLTIRPFRDPSTTAPVLWVKTGIDGQMATYQKSTSDASLFNHILISGESSDSQTIPVFAESINNDPLSKTSIQEIGDRYWEYSSPLIVSTDQAQTLADSYLAIKALEEFELDFDMLMLPWLEVGDIIGWIDPNPRPGDPSSFLMTSMTLPLKLGPMSAVGKRTTIVGG